MLNLKELSAANPNNLVMALKSITSFRHIVFQTRGNMGKHCSDASDVLLGPSHDRGEKVLKKTSFSVGNPAGGLLNQLNQIF